nr:MAG TPA: hypothetical protein [Caudoviricetes sp.]
MLKQKSDLIKSRNKNPHWKTNADFYLLWIDYFLDFLATSITPPATTAAPTAAATPATPVSGEPLSSEGAGAITSTVVSSAVATSAVVASAVATSAVATSTVAASAVVASAVVTSSVADATEAVATAIVAAIAAERTILEIFMINYLFCSFYRSFGRLFLFTFCILSPFHIFVKQFCQIFFVYIV